MVSFIQLKYDLLNTNNKPGVYFVPFLLADLKANASSIGRFINWTTVDGYMDIGGVRIEDIVVIMNNTRIVL